MRRIKLSEHLDKEKKSRKEQVNKQVLYNFEWQALRTSLDFSTSRTTLQSINLVKNYVSEAPDNEELIKRVWQALNLMAATRMGFSGLYKLIKDLHKLEDLKQRDLFVSDYREELSAKYQELKNLEVKLISDSEIKQINDLKEASLEDFSRVYSSLVFRYENASQSAARPELKNYLDLMREEFLNKKNSDKDYIIRELLIKLKGLRKSRKDKIMNWGKGE